MSLGKHIKEHLMLGVSGFGSSTFTVGAGSQFSSIFDAAAVASALPVMTGEITTTFTSAESNVGGTLDKRLITGDTASSLDSFDVGQVVGVEIDGSGCPIIGIVYSDGSNPTILLRNPLLVDLAATSCVVGIPSYKSIVVMPNHNEIIDGSPIAIPSFTTTEAFVRGTTRLEAISGQAIFTVAGTSNETRFKGLGLSSKNVGGVQLINYAGHNYQSDTYIQDVDGFSAAQDGFYFGDGVVGGIHLTGSNIKVGYDGLRLRQHREVNILNNVLDAYSLSAAGGYTQSSVLAIGTGAAPTTVPLENYNIANNTLKAFGQDLISGVLTHGDVRTIDIRNRISSGAFVNITNNNIYATGDDAGAVTGVHAVGNAGGETPTITCIGNTFDIRNDGAGAQLTMDSGHANYTIDRADNVQLNGVLGANTAAVATV